MSTYINWHDMIGKEKKQPYFIKTLSFIADERQAGKITHPLQKDIFNAFKYTKLSGVTIVTLGQDPYHRKNQVHGLSFSVRPNIPIPPSLRNIYKKLENNIPSFKCPKHGCLQGWAKQGVLLLNAALTVEEGNTHSHANLGWKIFTDKVISWLNQYCNQIIFLLWGLYARKKENFINKRRHHVLKAPHPSLFFTYRGFFGCQHFSKTNTILKKKGCLPIDW